MIPTKEEMAGLVQNIGVEVILEQILNDNPEWQGHTAEGLIMSGKVLVNGKLVGIEGESDHDGICKPGDVVEIVCARVTVGR